MPENEAVDRIVDLDPDVVEHVHGGSLPPIDTPAPGEGDPDIPS